MISSFGKISKMISKSIFVLEENSFGSAVRVLKKEQWLYPQLKISQVLFSLYKNFLTPSWLIDILVLTIWLLYLTVIMQERWSRTYFRIEMFHLSSNYKFTVLQMLTTRGLILQNLVAF